MFKIFKDKIRDAIGKFSKKVGEEVDVREKIKEKKEELKKEKLEEEIKDRGFIRKFKERITTRKISEKKFEEIFSGLELALLENNVALEVIEKIKEDLRENLMEKQIKRGKIEESVKEILKNTLKEILDVKKLDLGKIIEKCKNEKRPCLLLVVGYNGSGKSISCAKLGLKLKNKGYRVLLAAGDTFRAAGSIQLVEYGKLVDILVVHNENTKDSCSVIFDAIKHAKSKHFDVVVADTSGRIHSDIDLMDELKKIIRVNNPDLIILVLDVLSGTDVVEQMREFDKAIDIDGVILTKMDAYEKGGAFLSATYTGKKPILGIGCGQLMGDFKEYNINEILKSLGF